MARPRKFDKDAAIDVAVQEFWRNGYEATSVKALSEKLGIERASFYNAFGSREEMFKQALARYGAQTPMVSFYEEVASEPIKPALTRFFRALCEARSSDPEHRGCLGGNTLAELGPERQDLLDHVTCLFAMECDRLEGLFRTAIQRGELPDDTDPRQLALSVCNLLIGTNLQAKIVHDQDTLWRGVSGTLKALNLLDEDE